MVMLSAPTKCVEFGLRRAQGPNGALTASKYAYLGGFEASSNVMAGYHFGVPVAGTLAHSMIMSYEDESDVAHSRKLSLPRKTCPSMFKRLSKLNRKVLSKLNLRLSRCPRPRV